SLTDSLSSWTVRFSAIRLFSLSVSGRFFELPVVRIFDDQRLVLDMRVLAAFGATATAAASDVIDRNLPLHQLLQPPADVTPRTGVLRFFLRPDDLRQVWI